MLSLLVESGVLFFGLQVSVWFGVHAQINYATVAYHILVSEFVARPVDPRLRAVGYSWYLCS
jgi:hypothetical protein